MKRTITWLLYIFMSVQIVLGCAWFVSNFFHRQQFSESFASFLPAGVIFLIQLFAAGFSTWYMLGKMGFGERKGLRGLVCGFLLTVPFLLQMHMAELVWSFSLSAFLWMFGLLTEIIFQGFTKKRGCLLAAAYVLYGIICPDGVWLGGALLLIGSFFISGKSADGEAEQKIAVGTGGAGARVRFRLTVFLTAGVVLLANASLNRAFPDARQIYRENNPGTAAVSRFVWPNFATNYFFWDEEVKAVLSEDDAVRLCQRIDLLEKEFYPAMEETYGTVKATKLCLKMGYRCLMDRSRETVAEIGRDFADYLLIPFTIEKNLQGRGVSLTAWNYGRMKAHAPRLVKYYYRYGLFELPVLLLGSILLWWFHRNRQISQWMRRRAAGEETKEGPGVKRKDGRIPVQWKLLFFAWLLFTFWYTMRSNLPIDYKLVLPELFIWYLASVGGLLCQNTED